ncbi:hypothetical protein BJ165DRAFT_1558818 [Panaeolus papilionaceus]|nr:hypothetical protein BJ165DRAFT_1558818 [Panaeolus papilionaceus]
MTFHQNSSTGLYIGYLSQQSIHSITPGSTIRLSNYRRMSSNVQVYRRNRSTLSISQRPDTNRCFQRITLFLEILDGDPMIAPSVDTFWLYGSQFRDWDPRIQHVMKLWTSPVLCEILDRLTSLKTFAFEINTGEELRAKNYFTWDTLGRAVQNAIRRLVSRPSILSLKFTYILALPLDLITCAPNLTSLHVYQMDEPMKHNVTVVTQSASMPQHESHWRVKYFRTGWGCPRFVSALLPIVEDRFIWTMGDPKVTIAIVERSRHTLKDLFLEAFGNYSEVYSAAEGFDPRLGHYKSLVTLRLSVPPLAPGTFRAITSFLNVQFEHPSLSITYLQMQISDFNRHPFIALSFRVQVSFTHSNTPYYHY